jgi:ferredoxin
MRAVVDPEKCIGCTLCTQICPEVFKMEDDKAIAYVNPVPQAFEDSCKEASQRCPVEAIIIER